jgi:hypothetical protein
LFADACLPQTNYVAAALRESNRLMWRSQAIDYSVILSRQADLYTQRAWLYYEQGHLARAAEYAALAEATAGTQVYAGRPIAVELRKLAHR